MRFCIRHKVPIGTLAGVSVFLGSRGVIGMAGVGFKPFYILFTVGRKIYPLLDC